MTQEKVHYPESWKNIHDSNPKEHGGIFIKYESGYYHAIVTTFIGDTENEFTNEDYSFQVYLIDTGELWENPEKPLNGFTDKAVRWLREYSNPPFHLEHLDNPDILPEDVSMKENMEWILNNHNDWVIESFIHSYCGYVGSNTTDYSSDYWNYLENQGIDTEKFR